jgi:acyl transferase domain-containing protein
MAPNGDAQEHMLWEAYERAGIVPSTVDYVEAHGTGTPTGDGEEIKALAKVFGAGRPAGAPCLIGSVKPNIGHVEGGSGITGVIKTVLALQHEQIPPSLHNEPNPAYEWETAGLKLIGELSPWPSGGETRRAGVSSYGVGGTIAHVILEEAPELGWEEEVREGLPTAAARIPAVFPISAMSEAGLRALAGSVADWVIEHPEAPLSEIGHTLALHRSHLTQRGAVVAGSTKQLVERLRQLADGQTAPGVLGVLRARRAVVRDGQAAARRGHRVRGHDRHTGRSVP